MKLASIILGIIMVIGTIAGACADEIIINDGGVDELLTIASDAGNSYRVGDKQEWGISLVATAPSSDATFKYWVGTGGDTFYDSDAPLGNINANQRRVVTVRWTIPDIDINKQYYICGQIQDKTSGWKGISEIECKGFSIKDESATTTLWCDQGEISCVNNDIYQVNGACLNLKIEDCESSGLDHKCVETSDGANCEEPKRVCYSEGCGGYDCRIRGCSKCYSCDQGSGECKKECDPTEYCSKDADCNNGICISNQCKLCEPNQKYCFQSANKDRSRQCNSIGTGWYNYEDCPEGCSSGECEETIVQCDVGDSICRGNIIKECEKFGITTSFVEKENCADSNAECIISSDIAACAYGEKNEICCKPLLGSANWKIASKCVGVAKIVSGDNCDDEKMQGCDSLSDCPTGQICGYDGVCTDDIKEKCEDGTVIDKCSQALPKFCNGNKELVDSSSVCGCPSGWLVDGDGKTCCKEGDCTLCSNGDTVKATCSDKSERTVSKCSGGTWEAVDSECGNKRFAITGGVMALIIFALLLVGFIIYFSKKK